MDAIEKSRPSKWLRERARAKLNEPKKKGEGAWLIVGRRCELPLAATQAAIHTKPNHRPVWRRTRTQPELAANVELRAPVYQAHSAAYRRSTEVFRLSTTALGL